MSAPEKEQIFPQIPQTSAEKNLRQSASSAGDSPEPKISVIVPVYKVEKYLPVCIESVLAQTFTDFELILVDDGSPDNSGAICDAYAARDPRIRVFHKENGGVSSARNLGLDHARGEWIGFVDPDDWIEREMYGKLYCAGMASDADFVWCDFWTESDSMVALHRQDVVSADAKNMIPAFLSGQLYGAVWCKLIRTVVLRENKIYFSTEIGFCEDLLVSIQLSKVTRKAIRVPIPFYHYRVRENSATSRFSEVKSLADYSFVLNRVREILEEDVSLWEDVLNNAACVHKIRMLKSRSCPSDLIRCLRSNLQSNDAVPFMDKCMLVAFNILGRAGAIPFIFAANLCAFVRSKIKRIIFSILKRQYSRKGMSMRIVVADENFRLFLSNFPEEIFDRR